MSEYAEIIEGQIITGKNNKDIEIERLKELLKECQYMILAYSINHDTFTKEKVRDIVNKIDNAIGEEI